MHTTSEEKTVQARCLAFIDP